MVKSDKIMLVRKSKSEIKKSTFSKLRSEERNNN